MVKAVAVLCSNVGVSGTIYFAQEGEGSTAVTGTVSGLTPGLHGFHVHAFGDATNGCMSTGPHFDPAGKEHGAPEDEIRHAGDLGNITVGVDGTGVGLRVQIPLRGPNSIVGRAIVVHADPDDLGRGNKQELVPSLTTPF
ncbi:hypothetical protein RJ639_043891 [Escallonia herrerae]|uniref:superoxide dismutase n=1 Tax=Escallonia herrerae TaxID=1293975 RepID=A0AA89B2N5_9ASTE|nr:hypothetical protein RJ639_043891 [Escallonia herrerae]